MVYESVRIETGFHADLVVENKVIVEIKVVQTVAPVLRHSREMTLLCSPIVTQHHSQVTWLLPADTAVLPLGKRSLEKHGGAGGTHLGDECLAAN